MKQILITGANGFIGRHLCAKLLQLNFPIKAITRNTSILQKNNLNNPLFTLNKITNINEVSDWSPYLSGVNVIVHLAARVHILNQNEKNSKQLFQKTNVEATKKLLISAAKKGIKKFIFLSTIQVHGNESSINEKITENSPIKPINFYAQSKIEAEKSIIDVCNKYEINYCIIRPPLVYGPNVKANFLKLLNLVNKQIPSPLKNIKSLRSMVSVYNLTDFIISCINCEQANNEIFLVSDDNDISVSELLEKIAFYMNKRNLTFPFPLSILKFFCKIIRKEKELNKISNYLQVDIVKSKNILNWKPTFSFDYGLKKTVEHFIN